MGEAARGSWSPFRHLRVHHPDVHVHEVELPGDLLGCVDRDRRTIWLDSRLTEAGRRCTLAHEIGHLERGVPCDPAAAPAEEQVIDRWAARLLIDIHALVRALQWSPDLDQAADELWVDVDMLRARLAGLTDDEQVLMDMVLRIRRTA